MTNVEIMDIAMNQSAIDSSCHKTDFLKQENKVVISTTHSDARKYLELPFLCDLTSYGNCIVASVSKELEGTIHEYINKYPIEHCFETPNLIVLQEKLKPYDLNICFMAEYFLPDMSLLKPQKCEYTTRVLYPNDFIDLYIPEWSNALCEKRKKLDVLAMGAFDKDKLIGLAACSSDCDTMWQIGIDVLPSYRNKGIGASLTNNLALEIVNRSIVPFYCCAWSNIKSVKNALKSGFRPAWVQLTVKKNDFIAICNR